MPRARRNSLPNLNLNPFRFIARSLASLRDHFFWQTHLNQAIGRIEWMKRELPSPEMLMVVPLLFQGKGCYRSLKLKQNMGELLSLVKILEARRLENVCEIGTFKGGTLFIWCQLAADKARIFSIDLPGGPFGGGYDERAIPFFQSFRKHGQMLECIRGDSHSPATHERLAGMIGQRQVDFLFIDGDHSYHGVKKDFEDYSPFVGPGGIIAFHDIVKRENEPEIQVWRFWKEIMQNYSHDEFIEPGASRRKIGIGVIYA
jgi:predicted O-methyltransferase YrrM